MIVLELILMYIWKWYFEMQFAERHYSILTKSSLRFVPIRPIDSMPALVQMMAGGPFY